MSDSPPSRLKRFWPTYLVCRNVSNASASFSLRRMRSCSSWPGFWYFCSTLSWNHLRWAGVLDVHVLDAGRAAVRVAQDAEDVAELHLALAAEAARDELAVEVPERQAVLLDLEVGVGALRVLERVDVGHQVAAHAERVDELLHAGGLVDALGEVDVDVGGPVDGGVRDAERGEDRVVEAALPDEQLVHLLEELARAGALDDAVVVRAREGDRLADRELVERLLARALELRRVLEGAGADDAALALHEAGDRVHRADAAGVGQRERRALEVGGGELVAARPDDQVLVGGEVLAEGQGVGALDARHHERAGAVGLGQVDGDAEVDVRRGDHRRLAVDLGVEDVLARELLERLDERPADQVGEADLAAARARHVVVDDDAVVDHQLRRDGAHARGRGDRQRLVHVGRERLGHAAEGGDLVLLGRLLGGGCLGIRAPARGSAAARRAWRSCGPRAARRPRGSAP